MNKSLVAFFSATGTTKKTAELIASATNADFYEILPNILPLIWTGWTITPAAVWR